jgi:hypothetical protein
MVGLGLGTASVASSGGAVDEMGVGATCGAQAVITTNATTKNKYNKRLGNILISLYWPRTGWVSAGLMTCAQEEKKGTSQHVPMSEGGIGCLP